MSRAYFATGLNAPNTPEFPTPTGLEIRRQDSHIPRAPARWMSLAFGSGHGLNPHKSEAMAGVAARSSPSLISTCMSAPNLKREGTSSLAFVNGRTVRSEAGHGGQVWQLSRFHNQPKGASFQGGVCS